MPIAPDLVAPAQPSNGKLVPKRYRLPHLDCAEHLSGAIESYCDASSRGHVLERGGNIIIRLEQKSANRIHHSHVEVASSANAKAFVPASTTPE